MILGKVLAISEIYSPPFFEIYMWGQNKIKIQRFATRPYILLKEHKRRSTLDDMEGIGSYDCEIEINKNDDGSWHVELYGITIRYVHELQNVYYILIGKELEIIKK